MKFTASRLSEGNKVFPAEIQIEENGVNVKIPGFLNGKSTYLSFIDISGTTVDTPLIGFSTIKFHAKGTRVIVHGFTSEDVKEIKNAIEKGRNIGSNKSQSNSYYDESESDQIVSVKPKGNNKKYQEEEKIEILNFDYSDNPKEIQNKLDELLIELKTSKWRWGNEEETIINNKKLNKILAKYELGLKKLQFYEKDLDIIKINKDDLKSIKLKKFFDTNLIFIVIGGVMVFLMIILAIID